MKLNKFKLISIILSFALSGCGESTFERMAKEYDVSEHEAYACYQEFGVDARSVLEFLLERRKPFPLSYFSDDWAVAGAECNTVIELKQAQHDAFLPPLS